MAAGEVLWPSDWGGSAGYVVVIVAFIWTLDALEVRLAPLLGALGIGGLAVAFAAQSILGVRSPW